MQENVTGMVLQSAPVGEYDKRVVILTKELGRISAFAKGARRQYSPFLACTDPFTFGEFAIYKGKNSYSISSIKVKNYFSDLREELEDIYMGLYFCELAGYFTRENMEASLELNLIYQSLRALKVPSLTRNLVRYIYEFKMIALNGEAPRIFECRDCGSKENLIYFYPTEACIRCNECQKKSGEYILSATTIYTMQRILASNIEKLYTFTVSNRVEKELGTVISKYRELYVPTTFKSLELID